jgi:protein involved in polysaccharide export with SLBB domain
MITTRWGGWLAGALCLCAGLASAQQPAAPSPQPVEQARGVTPTVREQLQQQLVFYQNAAQSPAYSEALRAEARQDSVQARARLREGDFKVGDRISVVVEQQPTLSSDSFAVSAGPALILPGVGSINLAGVLVDEMESAVRMGVSRVYRGAVVRAERLVRIQIEGGVARPGFLSVRGTWRLDDLIQAAGGPNTTAQLSQMRLERGKAVVLGGDSLQTALRTARTLNDMQFLDGDRLVVPVATPADAESRLRVLYFVTTLPVAIIGLINIFRGNGVR